MKRIFSILFALVLVVSFSLVTAVPVGAATIDLAVNDENPWTDGAFTFENILPGGDPMAFDFKLHNVGDDPGILTFSMSVSENDMAGAPAPNMSADEFASLVYVEAVHYQYIWLTDPEGPYTGSVRDDLPSWLAMDVYFGNNDGYVSLYEICQAGTIPYDDEGNPLDAGAEITYFIEFQLGDSLEGSVAGGAILTGVEDNSSQGDGVSVTITATLGTDIEQSSGNVFQAFGVAGPVLNSTTDVTYTTIQAAVDAASPGDTIIVHEGTYTEQVVITTSDLMLKGVGNPKPVITVGAGTKGPIVHVLGATDVSIVGFEIDGAGNGFAGGVSGWDRFVGIAYQNASGTVRNNEVHGIKHPSGYEGAQSGVGIYAYASDVGIHNNVVYDYQKNGITANLAGDSRIHGNTVTGWGPTSLIAQNGIQIGYEATGSVKKNTVVNNWYIPSTWTAAGVLVFAADNVRVVNNTINDNEIGVDIETLTPWPSYYPTQYGDGSVDNNKIIRNKFMNNGSDIDDGGTATKAHANVP